MARLNEVAREATKRAALDMVVASIAYAARRQFNGDGGFHTARFMHQLHRNQTKGKAGAATMLMACGALAWRRQILSLLALTAHAAHE